MIFIFLHLKGIIKSLEEQLVESKTKVEKLTSVKLVVDLTTIHQLQE